MQSLNAWFQAWITRHAGDSPFLDLHLIHGLIHALTRIVAMQVLLLVISVFLSLSSNRLLQHYVPAHTVEAVCCRLIYVVLQHNDS